MKLINFEKRIFINGKLQGKAQIDFQHYNTSNNKKPDLFNNYCGSLTM